MTCCAEFSLSAGTAMVTGFLFVLSLLLAAEAMVVDLNSDNFDQVWLSNVWLSRSVSADVWDGVT